MIDPTVGTIRECLGHLVYGDEDDELEDAVVRLLKSQGKTLCTVEYATAGSMAEWLSRASAHEECYLGGHVIRSTAMLSSELGDSAALVETAGASSREVAEALASICRTSTGADYCLVVGPFPEPDSSDPAPPYHFALATPEKVTVKASTLAGHQSIWIARARQGRAEPAAAGTARRDALSIRSSAPSGRESPAHPSFDRSAIALSYLPLAAARSRPEPEPSATAEAARRPPATPTACCPGRRRWPAGRRPWWRSCT